MFRMSDADILHARHVPGAASGRAADGTASKRQNLATQAARAETGPLGAGVDAKATQAEQGGQQWRLGPDTALLGKTWRVGYKRTGKASLGHIVSAVTTIVEAISDKRRQGQLALTPSEGGGQY